MGATACLLWLFGAAGIACTYLFSFAFLVSDCHYDTPLYLSKKSTSLCFFTLSSSMTSRSCRLPNNASSCTRSMEN